jgi:putative tryptophan/tyrosine transport system substrate-binding protein
MVTIGGTVPAQAAKSATTDIPIVVAIGSDPVKNGLVTNLNRPGGKVTAVNLLSQDSNGPILVACWKRMLPGEI